MALDDKREKMLTTKCITDKYRQDATFKTQIYKVTSRSSPIRALNNETQRNYFITKNSWVLIMKDKVSERTLYQNELNMIKMNINNSRYIYPEIVP